MEQPQPYLYDGIFYSSNKRTRSISPINKTYNFYKKVKYNESNIHYRSKRTNENYMKFIPHKKVK